MNDPLDQTEHTHYHAIIIHKKHQQGDCYNNSSGSATCDSGIGHSVVDDHIVGALCRHVREGPIGGGGGIVSHQQSYSPLIYTQQRIFTSRRHCTAEPRADRQQSRGRWRRRSSARKAETNYIGRREREGMRWVDVMKWVEVMG